MPLLVINSIFFCEGGAAIVVSPADAMIRVGEVLSLPCMASGIPTPQITWFRDATPLLPEAYNISVSTFSNESSHFTLSVLHLCDLQVLDSNIYVCIANNTITQGSATAAASFMIEVQGRAAH